MANITLYLYTLCYISATTLVGQEQTKMEELKQSMGCKGIVDGSSGGAYEHINQTCPSVWKKTYTIFLHLNVTTHLQTKCKMPFNCNRFYDSGSKNFPFILTTGLFKSHLLLHKTNPCISHLVFVFLIQQKYRKHHE